MLINYYYYYYYYNTIFWFLTEKTLSACAVVDIIDGEIKCCGHKA